jgi:hypothetical protein
VGEEIADVGRHSGRAIRALARTISGQGLAIVAEDADGSILDEELKELRPALGTLVQLVAARGRTGEPALRLRKAKA